MGLAERMLALSADCFDAALDPTRWTSTLAGISHELGAVGCDLHLLHEEVTVAAYMGAQPPEVLDEYLERFIHREPRSIALATLAPGRFVADPDIADRDTFVRHDYYTDFLARAGMGWCLAAVPYRNGPQEAYLGIHFPRSRKLPDAVTRHAAGLVLPALSRAVAAHFRLAEVELGQAIALEALDQARGGIAVLDGAARMLLANVAARAAFDDREAFLVRGGRVVPLDDGASGRFEALVRDAVDGVGGRGGALILRVAGHARYSVFVNPAPSALRERTRAAALVFVNDLRPSIHDGAARALSELFGLTPAEARLAAGLLQGGGLRELADGFGISYETARSELRQVFAKVGVRKQAELVTVLGNALRWR
ncbi:MAG: helix-turn-helix transcriptional regulator [Gammaproteobacteria bacterium]